MAPVKIGFIGIQGETAELPGGMDPPDRDQDS